MWRISLIVLTVLLKCVAVSGQPSQGFNLAQILQQRTNRLQQMMLENLRRQGTPVSMTTGITSPARSSGAAGQTSGSVPASTGANDFIPVNQLLQQQRNMQSQLLQNMMNFQRSMQTSPTTQTQTTDNRFMTGGQSQTGSGSFLVDRRGSGGGGGTSSSSTGQSTPTGTGFRSMFTSVPSGNSSFGTLFNDFGFPTSSGSFWTQDTQTPTAGQSTGSRFTSGMTSSPASTFNPSFGNQGTPVPTFAPTTFNQGASGSNFGSGSPGERTSGQTFSPTSGNPGTSRSTFGQTSGSPGFTFSNDLSSAFSSAFNNNGRGTGTGSSFFTGTGRDVTSTGSGFNTQPTARPIPTPTQPALQCTEEFEQFTGHTLCLTDSQLVTNGGLTPGDRQVIVQMHNQLRAAVQPPAMDLMTLQWDERLASVADKWARQCTLAHDSERRIPVLGMTIGQNVAVGYEDWAQAIQQWYNEIRLYRYGLDPDSYLGPDGWRQVAHFTQIVQNGTHLIGCGFAVCPTTEYIRFFVCNYAAGQSDLASPYTAGTQCGMCPNNCVNGLCDCGGILCVNKGRLDPGTCTCECPKPYKGRSCEVLDCPVADNWICGRDWPASFCDRFYNVPEECPIMCGLCPASATVTPEITVVPNVTFTSAHGCLYNGARDNLATCKQYGDSGADMKMCATEGGSVGCGECDRYFNIKKDYCPVMCGLCDPPCTGKRCYNGGTLETRSCRCQCRKPFTGEFCDYAQCPISGDPAFCRFWPPRYCRQYFNVPEECPFMCGICKPDMMSPTSPAITGSVPNTARTTDEKEIR